MIIHTLIDLNSSFIAGSTYNITASLQKDRLLYAVVCFDYSHSYSPSILSTMFHLTRAELTWFIAIQVEILQHLCRQSNWGPAYRIDNCLTYKVEEMKYGLQEVMSTYVWMCRFLIRRVYVIKYITYLRILRYWI